LTEIIRRCFFALNSFCSLFGEMLSGSRTKESSPFDCDYPLHFVLFCSFWFFSIVDLI